jgi:DDE_Tnp_1-associated
LPILIKQFTKISDPRRAKSVTHKIAVVMLYGLFAFIFRLSSLREINRELSSAVIFENLQKLFPELESIPHADTLARVLEKINVRDIEKAHMKLINQLIRNKKFKKLLIAGCLPIAIDGTQKLYRDGELHDLHWLSRKVGDEGSNQQYVYVLEANIVFKNGLTIPLLTEYLKTDWSLIDTP